MINYNVKIIEKTIAKELIIKNHYSHKWTSCRYSLGLFENYKLIGVAVFGFPVGRQVIKSITQQLTNGDVLELTRFWIEDCTPKNTESWFLGQTFTWLRNNTKIKVLISYSDPMYGHRGIIYQATNWLYQGNNTMLVRGYLHKINGQVMHPRSVVAKYGSIKVSELKKIDPSYERIVTMKKHRYLFILHKNMRRVIMSSLKHPVLPYPKDDKNTHWK